MKLRCHLALGLRPLSFFFTVFSKILIGYKKSANHVQRKKLRTPGSFCWWNCDNFYLILITWEGGFFPFLEPELLMEHVNNDTNEQVEVRCCFCAWCICLSLDFGTVRKVCSPSLRYRLYCHIYEHNNPRLSRPGFMKFADPRIV